MLLDSSTDKTVCENTRDFFRPIRLIRAIRGEISWLTLSVRAIFAAQPGGESGPRGFKAGLLVLRPVAGIILVFLFAFALFGGRTFRPFVAHLLKAIFLLVGQDSQQFGANFFLQVADLLFLVLAQLKRVAHMRRKDFPRFKRRRRALFLIRRRPFLARAFVASLRRLR